MTFVITGPSGCGKATVLGLFHQAQMIYTQKNEGHRTLLEPEYQTKVSNMYNTMINQKSLPSERMFSNQDKPDLRMLIAFEARKSDESLTKKILKILKRDNKIYENHLHIIMEVEDMPTDDVSDFLNDGDEIGGNLKKFFESNPLMIVIDASKLSVSSEGDIQNEVAHQDQEISTFFLALNKYINEFGKKEEKNIWFMFNNMDDIGDDVRDRYNKKIGGEGSFLEKLKGIDSKKRKGIGRKLIDEFLPSTGNLQEGSILEEDILEDAYFFSWVQKSDTDINYEGDRKLRTKTVKRGVDHNVFPVEMYEKLIDHIKEKLKDPNIPDSREKIKTFYNKKGVLEEEAW